MGKIPYFSVIVPAYNSAAYIRKGLESIATQSFADYELIVPCDSCKDDTEKIAREYGANAFPVRFGLDGLTRNAGLDIAQGEWVLFMDDDDWFLHEYCFEQLAEMTEQQHDADAIIFSYIWRGSGYYRQTPENVSVQAWSKCWRRTFIGDTRFSIRHYWSDCDFHNKIMRKPHRFAYWDMPLYYYNFGREGSISKQWANAKIANYEGKPGMVILKDPALKGE